jgi:hypothetical protein
MIPSTAFTQYSGSQGGLDVVQQMVLALDGGRQQAHMTGLRPTAGFDSRVRSSCISAVLHSDAFAHKCKFRMYVVRQAGWVVRQACVHDCVFKAACALGSVLMCKWVQSVRATVVLYISGYRRPVVCVSMFRGLAGLADLCCVRLRRVGQKAGHTAHLQ